MKLICLLTHIRLTSINISYIFKNIKCKAVDSDVSKIVDIINRLFLYDKLKFSSSHVNRNNRKLMCLKLPCFYHEKAFRLYVFFQEETDSGLTQSVIM